MSVLEPEDTRARLHVPHAERGVERAGGQQLALGRHDDGGRLDLIRRAVECANKLAVGHVPQVDAANLNG